MRKCVCGILILSVFSLGLASSEAASDTTPIHAAPADLDAVKKVLAVAVSSTDPSTLHPRLAEAIGKIAEVSLRKRMEELLPDLESAAALHAKAQIAIANFKTIGAISELAPGGPDWLRSLVGESAMEVFQRLVAVDINDKQSPHNKDYHLLENIRDEWLANLDGLTDLKHLNLANTAIHGPGLKHVGTLIHLEALNLTLCPVTDEYLQNLSALTEMKQFGLASAKCDGTGFKYLGKMTQLENLNFHYTPVNDDGLREICRMTSLERLEIVHCHWTDSGAANLANLKNLQRLQLGSRQASGAAIANLRGLPKLRELDLHDLNAPSEAIANASNIPTLQVLRVYLNPVKDDDVKQIARLENLEELVVSGAKMTDAGIETLGLLKKLKKLTLSGSKVNPVAIEKLMMALPGLQIGP